MVSGYVHVSIGSQYEDVTPLKLWSQELQQEKGGPVSPVEVIEN